MSTRESITYTGRNGAEVRDWINADPGCGPDETWFLTKGMTASTGGQAWRYARDQARSEGDAWGAATAAFFDPRGGWVPTQPGDVIERQGSGYGVRRE